MQEALVVRRETHIDGEIVVVKDGRSSFSELQAELAKGNQDSLLFYAFDLLYLEGFDLRKAPLVERKRILKMLFDETDLASPIIYSEHLQTDGNKMLEHACPLPPAAPPQSRLRLARSTNWEKYRTAQISAIKVGSSSPEGNDAAQTSAT